MPTPPADRLREIKTLPSLVKFLRDELEWPVEDEALADADDMTFDWSADSLRLKTSQRERLTGGRVRQLRDFVPGQPWGIFLVEFGDERVYRTALREILRGLVSSRRRDSSLPSWKHENLLFVCATRDYERISFAHFRGEQMQKARLATFGWRRGSAYVRTLLEHNLPALEWPEDTSDSTAWLKQWTSAFDKEALTKRFYEVFAGNEKKGQRGTYQTLRDDLVARNKLSAKDASERALLLLNRLLFLYFIQKKGWLAQDTRFLRGRFDAHAGQPDKATYYREILVPLFERLSIEGARDEEPWNQVPFLNGGLFEEDSTVSGGDLKIANRTFGTIFEELLDRFNFTVTEDTPLDVEVAIDPEMLGKIFECLALKQEQGAGILAEVEGEADEKKDQRKLTGSYYTPRSIVHFMCQEALKEHLRSAWQKSAADFDPAAADATLGELMALPLPDPPTDLHLQTVQKLLPRGIAETLREALRTLRVVDPAVGSGAFLVGMLHEVVRLRALLDLHLTGRDRLTAPNYVHDLKKEVIERSLFGVDLQEQAVRLCELRLWLSLVVDYHLPEHRAGGFEKTVRRIPTLPNLSYRVVRGDSLLERLFGHAVQLDALANDPRSREIIDELRKEKEAFFALRDANEKRRRELVILEKQVRLAENLIEAKTLTLGESIVEQPSFLDTPQTAKERKAAEAQRALIQLWQDLRAKVHRAGEEVRRLLAQPRLPAHGDLLQLRQKYFQTKDSPTFFWQVDFAEVFSEKGGFDIVIANPPYIRQELLKKITPLLKPLYPEVAEKSVDAYVYFIEQGRRRIHEGGVLAYITSSTWTRTGQGAALRRHLREKATVRRFIDFGSLQVFEGVTTYPAILLLKRERPTDTTEVRGTVIKTLEPDALERELHAPGIIVRQKALGNDGWHFEDGRLVRLREKIGSAGGPLRDCLSSDIYRGVTTGLNEAFVVDSTTRDALVAQDHRSAKVLKPYLEGKDVERWHADWRGLWLIQFPTGWTNRTGKKAFPSEKKGFEFLESEYPAIAQWLASFAPRARARSDQGDWFWELRPCAYYQWFEGPKILSTKVSKEVTFCFDPTGKYCGNTAYVLPIAPDNLWILSVLNSRLMEFVARSVFVVKSGGFFEIQPGGLNGFPIARPSAVDRKKLSDLAEALSSDRCPNRPALEAELNDRVARLYGLTPEEQKIVEGILPAAHGAQDAEQGE